MEGESIFSGSWISGLQINGSCDFHIHLDKDNATIIVTQHSCLFQLYFCPVTVKWHSNAMMVIIVQIVSYIAPFHCRPIITDMCKDAAFSQFA